MQIVFRLAYSLVVAILFVLFVILGIRTFYEEPEAPEYPSVPVPFQKPIEPGEATEEPIYCNPDGRCFKGAREVSLEDPELSDEERLYMQEQLDYYGRQREYEDDRVDYHRNVFIAASILGVAAVAAGLFLYRRVEGIPLGLLLGGIGVVIFAWAQAAEDFGEIGMAPLFITVAVGLALVLAAGYWFLGIRGAAGEGGDSGV